jgi:hypothetical protein
MPSSSFPCSAVATTKVCKVHPKKHKKTKDSQVSIFVYCNHTSATIHSSLIWAGS